MCEIWRNTSDKMKWSRIDCQNIKGDLVLWDAHVWCLVWQGTLWCLVDATILWMVRTEVSFFSFLVETSMTQTTFSFRLWKFHFTHCLNKKIISNSRINDHLKVHLLIKQSFWIFQFWKKVKKWNEWSLEKCILHVMKFLFFQCSENETSSRHFSLVFLTINTIACCNDVFVVGFL